MNLFSSSLFVASRSIAQVKHYKVRSYSDESPLYNKKNQQILSKLFINVFAIVAFDSSRCETIEVLL